MKAYLKYCFTGTGARLLALGTLAMIAFMLIWIFFQEDYEQDILYTTITLAVIWLVFFIGNYFSFKKLKQKT